MHEKVKIEYERYLYINKILRKKKGFWERLMNWIKSIM